jgi:hypothetical protein
MFEDIISKLPQANVKNVYLSMDESNVDYMKSKLFKLEEFSDEEVYNLICKTYSYILDEMFISKNMELIKYLYTNPRFIMTLGNVLSRPDIKLTYLQVIYCNKLAYDYFTARGEKDKYIRALLLNLTKGVNRSIIPSLIGLGLNEELASYLANARYSSQKEDIQVRRLNLIIMNQDPDIMTEQMIVDIYGQLFDRITPLFSGIMYDFWPNELFINEEMEDVYATINIAILEIVNNLPEDIMYQLLKKFYESHQLINLDKKLRFNIYSFSKEDYPRLDYTLEVLKHEGIILPMR